MPLKTFIYQLDFSVYEPNPNSSPLDVMKNVMTDIDFCQPGDALAAFHS